MNDNTVAMDEQSIRTTSKGTILILFSGGLDSTTLLVKALRDDYDVDLLYVRGNQSRNKIGAERMSIQQIVQVCKSMFPDRSILDFESRSELTNEEGGFDEGASFVQPLQWFYPAVMCVRRVHSMVWMGYNSGDQFLSHLDDITLAWNTVLKFSKTYHVPIEFPLRYVNKRTMLETLPEELKLLFWVCELPEKHDDVSIGKKGFQACGNCPACFRLATELIAKGDAWMYRNYHRTVGIDPMKFLDFLNDDKAVPAG